MDARTAALRRLTEQVMLASQSGSPLDIRGGRTKQFYGGAPRGAPLDMSDLSGITSYEPTELVVTALAGTRLCELEETLAGRGQCLPFEPPHFAEGGTVGGMVAAGLAGPARFSAGALRDYVLGASLLNGAGETLTFGGQVMKNVAGYDVSRVLAGSMGILGVLCDVSLKVMPVPAALATLRFEMDEPAALEQLRRWAGLPLPLSATAWHRNELYVRLAGAQAAVGSVRQRLGGTEVDPPSADAWWRAVRDHRHAFFHGEVGREPEEVLWRLAVPDTTPPLALPGEQFLEWGGALRWVRSAAPVAQIRAAASGAGGHATLFRSRDKSAGVFTTLPPAAMAIHRRLKQAFDPAGIFNPGRLYAEL